MWTDPKPRPTYPIIDARIISPYPFSERLLSYRVTDWSMRWSGRVFWTFFALLTIQFGLARILNVHPSTSFSITTYTDPITIGFWLGIGISIAIMFPVFVVEEGSLYFRGKWRSRNLWKKLSQQHTLLSKKVSLPQETSSIQIMKENLSVHQETIHQTKDKVNSKGKGHH